MVVTMLFDRHRTDSPGFSGWFWHCTSSSATPDQRYRDTRGKLFCSLTPLSTTMIFDRSVAYVEFKFISGLSPWILHLRSSDSDERLLRRWTVSLSSMLNLATLLDRFRKVYLFYFSPQEKKIKWCTSTEATYQFLPDWFTSQDFPASNISWTLEVDLLLFSVLLEELVFIDLLIWSLFNEFLKWNFETIENPRIDSAFSMDVFCQWQKRTTIARKQNIASALCNDAGIDQIKRKASSGITMCTFGGVLKEYPWISVDCFLLNNCQTSRVFFISHMYEVLFACWWSFP